MNVVTLDFETYYDTDYSLTTLPTDNYIIDTRFKIHGVAVKLNNEPSVWWTGRDTLKLKEFDWSNTILVAHNTYLDGFIAHHFYKVQPRTYLCTMCMGRGLYGPNVSHSLASVAERLKLGVKGDELIQTKGKRTLSPLESQRLGGYACNDNDLCKAAFDIMYPLMPPAELDLIDLTLRMFIEPQLELDTPLLETYYQTVVDQKLQSLLSLEWMLDLLPGSGLVSFLEPEVQDKAKRIKDVLMSNDQLPLIFEKLGVKVATKKGKKGEIPALSKTDGAFKDLLKSPDPKVVQLAQARKDVKSTMAETRSEAFLDVGDRKFPILLYYAKAGPKRWAGGGGRNPQNLPRGSTLRKAITAPEGYVIGVADSAQIEARCNAYVASVIAGTECALMPVFRTPGGDPYNSYGTIFWGFEVTKETEFERWVAKQAVLGLGYQMSWQKFKWQVRSQADLIFEDEFCQKVVTTYRTTYPEIPKLWWWMQDMLEVIYKGGYVDMGFFRITEQGIRLPCGLSVIYNGLEREENGRGGYEYSYMGREQGKAKRVKLYGGKAVENLIQGLARTVVAEQMLAISKRYRIVMMAHDEVSALIPESEAEEGLNWMVEIMSLAPEWAKDLPVAAEGSQARWYSK